MKHNAAGINFWTDFDRVPTSKFEKLDDFKKKEKKKEEMVIKNK